MTDVPREREMSRGRRIGLVVVLVGVIGLLGYTGYVGYEGSRRLAERDGSSQDCRTPDVQFGWTYEAINYEIADDAELQARNADLAACSYEGATAGDAVVAADGTRIAGWYIPGANGVGPTGPTIVLVHGFKANKSGVLRYGAGLHEEFNLVAFDVRNTGRSSDDTSTGGVLEQTDLRAIIDWLERTKRPSHIGVLGNSLGAVTALAEVRDDPRIEALVLDSMHTRVRYQIEARVAAGGHLSWFGSTWAILTGIGLRTGTDIQSVDAEDTIEAYGNRPLLLIHGTADTEDQPARTQAFFDGAVASGIPAQLYWCSDSGHNAPAGMPVDVCRADHETWTSRFFADAFGPMP